MRQAFGKNTQNESSYVRPDFRKTCLKSIEFTKNG